MYQPAMAEIVNKIAAGLKTAREVKGFSQRELAQRSGLLQSHISRIEGGHVDLRVSSLAEIARALDLELTLVPRKALPAVKSMVRKMTGTGTRKADRPKPAYSLDEEHDD